jgi:UMF1 family MFS transporter
MHSLRAQRIGWYTIDWANSAFSTSVVTVFLGPYLTSVAMTTAVDGVIAPFGIAMHVGSWFSFCISLSVLLQVVVLPVVGAVVDRSHRKRMMLALTTLCGASATMGLFACSPEAGNYILGGALFIIANVFFGASVVVSNAFLNDIAALDERDAVSSRGWALGYLGGAILLAAHLVWYTAAPNSLTVRSILVSVGLWWALWTIVPYVMLRDTARAAADQSTKLRTPFSQAWTTLREAMRAPHTARFIIAYIAFNEAVQTVISQASVFGSIELGLGLDVLTQAVLVVQVVAIGGSLAFAELAKRTTTKTALGTSLIGWILVILASFFWVQSATQFLILAGCIAIVLGGTQALSRSLFSTMIPRGKEAEYFSLYELSDNGTAWIGPLLFGITLSITHSYRWAILSLLVMLIIGIIVLVRVDTTKAVAESQRPLESI